MSNILKTLAAGSVSGDYQIERSLRFNSADSAYLSRTPASAGNRKTWTLSFWMKRSNLGGSAFQMLFSTTNAGNERDVLYFPNNNSEQLRFYTTANSFGDDVLITSQVFRDVSAWYHIVLAVDTTQETSTNRFKLYVNGVQVTQFSSDARSSISQNTDMNTNNNIVHNIGRDAANASHYYGGYLTEFYLIDGQALTPSSFGEVDSVTGVWKPIRYAGTYGTNGFHLDFSDNSSTTALGYDAAGSNDWTPNNFSVTAGAGNDSLVDSPTQYGTDTGAGGEVRGNYCTLNPLYGSPAPTNGNLDVALSTQTVYGSFSFTSGKWYFEVTPTTSVTFGYIGVMDSTYLKTDNNWSSQSRSYSDDGSKYNGGNTAYGATWTTNDVIGVAVDMDAGTIAFYKNGASQGTAFTDLSGKEWRPMVYASSASFVTNFGQRPFAYTAPSGFKALCTTNLPDPTVVQGDDYFNTVLYTGTGSSQSITGVGFQPDFVWIKERNGAADHGLYDAVRGVQLQLETNTNAGETTEATGLTAFGTDGFTVGALAQLNTSADTYVAWNWNGGGSNATNTSGTITSTVRANTTAGFSIATFTGINANATVGHGLGVAPAMIILKVRSANDSWQVYHQSLGPTYRLQLNLTSAADLQPTVWNDTAPTSTVFSIGTNYGTTQMVAYCFAEVEGFSKFGSYTGNGSTDGPFVYTGFRPSFIIRKRTDSSVGGLAAWFIQDDKRAPYNQSATTLQANEAYSEAGIGPTNYGIDILSNGFKGRSSSAYVNASGGTYIYMAFAENPFKNALAR